MPPHSRFVERPHLPQRPRPGADDGDDDEGHYAAEDHARHDAEDPRGHAGLERADLVGRADEDLIDRGDAPEELARRERGHERPADDDADLVGRAAEAEDRERETEAARQGEGDHAEAEDGYTGEERPSGAAHRRAVR